MGTDRTPTYLRGIGVPPHTRTLWDAQSGYYDAAGTRLATLDGQTGTPVTPAPTRSTDMALRGHGEPTATIYARCRRGGLPGQDECGLLWSPTSTTTDLRGCDLPDVCSGYEGYTIAGTRQDPDSVTLPDGTVLETYYRTGTGVVVRRMSVAGLWGAEVAVTGDLGYAMYPCLIVYPEGRIHLYHWRVLSATEAQIALQVSDDSGATWVSGGNVLSDPVDLTAYPNVYRIRGAVAKGQLFLVGHIRIPLAAAAMVDAIIQWASSDGGYTLSEVEIFDPTGLVSADPWFGGYPDVVVLDDVFYIAFLGDYYDVSAPPPPAAGDRKFWLCRLGSAFERITGADKITQTGVAASRWYDYGAVNYEMRYGELALWGSDDGSLYVTVRDYVDGRWLTFRSPDGASTLVRTGASAAAGAAPSGSGNGAKQWYNAGTFAETPSEVCATETRGHTVLSHGIRTGAAASGWIAHTYLGGWTSETWPHLSGSLAPTYRTGTEYTRPGWCLPNAVGWTWTAGAGDAVVAPGRHQITAGSLWTLPVGSGMLPGSIAAGVIWEEQGQCNGAAPPNYHLTYTATIGDGAAVWYQAYVMIGPNLVQLWDGVAGAQVGATLTRTSPDTAFRIRISLAGSTVRAEILEIGNTRHAEDRGWQLIASTSALVAGAGVVSHSLTIGCAVDSYLEWGGWSSSSFTGDQLSAAPTSLTLYPRSMRTAPLYLGYGWSASAVTGPAAVGDSWTMAASYEYPPAALDPLGDTLGAYASPRWPWRSRLVADMPAGTATIRISYRLEESGSDERPESDLWYAWLDRLGLPPSTLLCAYYGGTWNTVATIPGETTRMNVAGRSAVVHTTGNTGANTVRRGELEGAIVYTPGGGGQTQKVIRDRPGTTRTGGSLPLIVELDATPPGAGAQDCVIWPRRALVVWRWSSFSGTVRGLQLRIPVAAPYPPDLWYEAGIFAFGPVWAWGSEYGHGRSITVRPKTEIDEAEDGSHLVRVQGPPRQEWEVSWDSEVALRDALTSAAPDYVRAAPTVGDPIQWARSSPMDVLDSVRTMYGSFPPVVYIPSIPLADLVATGAAVYVYGRGRGAIYSRIVEVVSADAVHGDEEVDETQRLQALRGREIE